MIEPYIREFLEEELQTIPVYCEEPESPPSSYIIIERTAGRTVNVLQECTVAIQSYGPSLLDAMTLNEEVKDAMEKLRNEDPIGGVHLDSDYNYSDTSTHRYRYQAVYDIFYYGRLT